MVQIEVQVVVQAEVRGRGNYRGRGGYRQNLDEVSEEYVETDTDDTYFL